MLCVARHICFRLFRDWARAAAWRTFWTAGTRRPIKMAMMAITTSSSISVKARPVFLKRRKLGIEGLPDEETVKLERDRTHRYRGNDATSTQVKDTTQSDDSVFLLPVQGKK